MIKLLNKIIPTGLLILLLVLNISLGLPGQLPCRSEGSSSLMSCCAEAAGVPSKGHQILLLGSCGCHLSHASETESLSASVTPNKFGRSRTDQQSFDSIAVNEAQPKRLHIFFPGFPGSSFLKTVSLNHSNTHKVLRI